MVRELFGDVPVLARAGARAQNAMSKKDKDCIARSASSLYNTSGDPCVRQHALEVCTGMTD